MEKYQNRTTYKGKFLASRVLAVAVINDEEEDEELTAEWTAYIRATNSNNFDEEFMDVAKHGDKLPKAIAEILFPNVPKNKRWR